MRGRALRTPQAAIFPKRRSAGASRRAWRGLLMGCCQAQSPLIKSGTSASKCRDGGDSSALDPYIALFSVLARSSTREGSRPLHRSCSRTSARPLIAPLQALQSREWRAPAAWAEAPGAAGCGRPSASPPPRRRPAGSPPGAAAAASGCRRGARPATDVCLVNFMYAVRRQRKIEETRTFLRMGAGVVCGLPQ